MRRLRYQVAASCDGFMDPDLDFGALMAQFDTFVMGPRTFEMLPGGPSLGGRVVVFSRTLDAPLTARTRIERAFDPDVVRSLKETSARPLSIGGPELAAQALRAALVDELQLFVVPVVVGGGKPWLPDDLHLALELADERRFTGGFVFLRYRTA